MKKTKKQKKRHFCFCFFALTFLSFIRFQCFWSQKKQSDSSNHTQQTAIENSEGFGSQAKKQNEKNKKTKKRHIVFCFFAYNFFVFSPISTFFAAKDSRRAQPPALQRAIGNTKGFGSYQKKQNEKRNQKNKKKTFLFLFFAITFLSFNRFPRSWSLKITGVALDFSRLRTRRNSEGFGSYEEKTTQKTKKNNKNIVFSIVFCSNFFVCHSISLFLVWKNHGRRQRLFEAKNTQKLQRVRKL